MKKTEKITIKNWAEADRPREKLLVKGISALSDAELIAILIGSGNRQESAVELSRRILNDQQNNLHLLGQMQVNELTDYHGIGEAKAISIVAAMELGKRRKLSDIINRKQIICSRDAYEYFYPFLADLRHEEFWILALDKSNKILKNQKISQGGTSSAVVDIKIIAKYAITYNAQSIILCHNHPSGHLKPSSEDKKITADIKNAMQLFNITVFDHLIIGHNNYFSFTDEGILK